MVEWKRGFFWERRTIAETSAFDSGRALKYATIILKRDTLKLLLLSVLLVGLPSAAVTALTNYLTTSDVTPSPLHTWITTGASMLAAMLSSLALQAVIARDAVNTLDDRRSNFGGVRDILALLALGLVTSLGIIGGFILLIIPGIVLSLAWMVVVPAMVTERLEVMEAIRRSNTLTGNARGAIFGLWVAVGLIGAMFSWLVQLAVGAMGIPLVNEIAGPALETLTGIVDALLSIAVYYELRWSKEGTPTESLAAIFA